MPMPSKQVVLFEGTGSAATLFSSGTLNTAGYDAIFVETNPSAAAAASSIFFRDMGKAGPTTAVAVFSTTADAAPNNVGWGLGVGSVAAGLYYKGGLAAPLPPLIRVEIDTLGAGVTAYMRIIGVRNHRGPDVASDPD